MFGISRFIGCKVLSPLVIAAALSAVTWASSAVAEGAFAVGSTGDLAKDGFAFGASINKPTRKAAIEQALNTCRAFTDAPKMAKRCALVTTFKGECYALAMDPKAGEPGTGWAVGPTLEAAEARAMATCEATAGSRKEFCKVDQSDCDKSD